MEVTRRFWIDAALVVVLAALAVFVSRPILLVGAATIGAWLLADQHRFARAIFGVNERIEVTQSIADEFVYTDDETTVTLEADIGRPASVDVTVDAGLPVGASVNGPTSITIPAGERSETAELTVRWPVAGTFQFDRPTIKTSDAGGRFAERFEAGPTPELEVEPGALQNLQIRNWSGEAHEYGKHALPKVGIGLDFSGLREYVSSDPAKQIDWKATSRLSGTYVREYEVEIDRKVALLIDGRGSMGDGREGETKLDYARHVALSFVERANRSNDSIGCYAVNEDGITIKFRPSDEQGQPRRVRNAISDLEPAAGSTRRPMGSTPAEMRRKAALLDDGSAFASRLKPYFHDSTSAHERIDDDPLYVAIQTYIRRLQGSVWTVIFTDDTRRREVYEAVTLARRYSSGVLVFLMPTVLFDRAAREDLDSAYERYADFDQFRRTLTGMERVSAFEVSPSDQLRSVVSADRTSPTTIQS